MRYNKILFDLDNTLIDFDHSEKNALKLNFEEFSIPYKQEYNEIYHEINDKFWKMLEKGEIERSKLKTERFEKLFSLLGVTGVDSKAFNDSYLINLGKGRKLLPNALETVKGVYDLGAKCYLITNGATSVQKARLTGQEFMKYISGICISESVGANKPSAEYFKKAEEIFGEKFDDKTLIVGDSLSSDIKGGINIGVDTCYVNAKKTPNGSGITPTYEIDEIIKVLDIIK